MNAAGLDRLTDGERAVLRELLRHGNQGATARALGLSQETVKTHLRNAREKCSASTSFGLARALIDHEIDQEEPTPFRVIPPMGGWGERPYEVTAAATPVLPYEPVDQVREERAAFDFVGMPPSAGGVADRSGSRSEGTRRLLTATAMTLMIVLAIILAFPLSESFQRLADLLDPPQH